MDSTGDEKEKEAEAPELVPALERTLIQKLIFELLKNRPPEGGPL